jgi:hypothetical protein
MKIKYLELGLMEIQAETNAESQAICGITEMTFKFLPAAVANSHGCRKIKGRHLNYCTIPDGTMNIQDGDSKPGIDTNIKKWAKLGDLHKFKADK